MDTPEIITHVSHCYGYGGIDLGLKRVFGRSLHTIAACEIEAFALWNGVAKSEAGQTDVDVPFWTNLKTFPFAEFHGLVDIYSAGFPCQPFSAAGKRGADEDPRHLFPHIKRGIEQMRPACVFLENVEGIISSKLAGDGWEDPAGTPVLLHVLRELERVGYRATAGVFSASEVGAPHQRKRVFIMAHHHHQRSQGYGRPLDFDAEEGWEDAGRYFTATCFPARPGEQQHAWEPPRVVNNSRDGRREGRAEHAIRSGWHASSGAGERTVANAKRPDEARRFAASGEASSGRAHDQLGGSGGASVGETLADTERLDPAGWRIAGDVFSTASRTETAEQKRQRMRDSADDCSGRQQDRQTESALGRDADGFTCGLDYAELCDSRVDELRLLGNGVVPATAERAFRVLASRLI